MTHFHSWRLQNQWPLEEDGTNGAWQCAWCGMWHIGTRATLLKVDRDVLVIGDHIVSVVESDRYRSRLGFRHGVGGWIHLPFCMVEAFG